MKKTEVNIFDYWRIIRKRSFTIIVTFLLGVAFAIFDSRVRPREFVASAVIRVEDRLTVTDIMIGRRAPAPATADAMVVVGYEVMKEAVKRLRLVEDGAPASAVDRAVHSLQASVKASRIKDTENYIAIEARADGPQLAADIANTIAEVFILVDSREKSKEARLVRQYIEQQLKVTKQKLEESERGLWDTAIKAGAITDRETILKKLGDMQMKLAELAEVLTDKHPGIVSLQNQIENQKRQLKDISNVDLNSQRLKVDIEIQRKLYAMLREELEKASISEAGKVTTTLIVNRAQPPRRPVGPDNIVKVFAGGICGLVMGLFLVLIKEQLDTSIDTIDDVEDYIKLPVLAIIPHCNIEQVEEGAKGWSWWLGKPVDKGRETKIKTQTLYKPTSPYAESYRILLTNITFALAKDKSKTLLFTSAGPQEGKTTVVTNLAITAARSGSRVLLIGCNLRRPTIYKSFDIKREPGLSDILIERITWQESLKSLPDFLRSKIHREIIERTPEMDNLKIITCGQKAPNPAELLASPEMERLLKRAREEFDLILLDSPPILPVVDGGILASKVDKVILVYQVGKTARNALYRAKVRLENLEADLCGIVLNDIRTEINSDGGTYYYHYKYYGADMPTTAGALRRFITALRKKLKRNATH